MRRIVFLACIGSVALALTAWGAPKGGRAQKSAKGGGAHSAHVVSGKGGGHAAPMRGAGSHKASMKGGGHVASKRGGGHVPSTKSGRHMAGRNAAVKRSRGISTARSKSGEFARTKSLRGGRMETARGRAAVNRERNLARADKGRATRAVAANARNAQISRATRGAAGTPLRANRQRNLTMARNVLANRAGDVRITNYWRNDRFRGGDYAAFYNYDRTWHDRTWWRSNYSNIVFVLGGWWYWNSGFWYPAWGYNPYGWYPYDGPIYSGYAGLRPGRVIVNVQVALRDQGYYAGTIDGRFGPQTRAALAAFQSDNGLAVTSAVDRPTLQTLGLA